MALPHQALVLVADGKKMLFLRNQGDKGIIDLRTEAHDQREDRKDREIKTDAAGSQVHAKPAGAASDQHHTDPTLARPAMRARAQFVRTLPTEPGHELVATQHLLHGASVPP